MMETKYGMEFVAILIFWGLVVSLIAWLIFTLINNTTNSKSNSKKKNALEINK